MSAIRRLRSCYGSAASGWRKRAGPREQRQIGQERGQDRQVGGRIGNDPSRAQKPFCRSYAPQAFAMFDDSNQYDDYDGPHLDTRVSAFRAERGLRPSDTVMIISWRPPGGLS